MMLACGLFRTFGQPKVPVFVSGTGHHESYRIPAIIRLPDDRLLAFCEGRVSSARDFGDIDIVLKRSDDDGRTWSAMSTVVDNDSLQAGNPAPVVDLSDPAYPNGRIFLFYNTGNNHEGEVRKGNGLREVWYITSGDRGETWSAPTNITIQVHRPKQPLLNAAYNFTEDWRSYANTPGHAMQFAWGAYKGRIFVAANHSSGDPKPGARDYAAHGYYTDDHGKTFQLAPSVNVSGSNESTATELSGDGLMMNMRNQHGDIRSRIVALSHNGGAMWDSVFFDRHLPDPVCEGSILTLGVKKGKAILAFSNAADTVNRDNLTLRISFDEGKTWKKNIVIDKGAAGKEKNHAAYSDIVKTGNGTIGVLYESEGYSRIVFTSIRWR
jgi:sialidase-1